MSFTYIGDLSTNLDYARFRLDDADATDVFLQDETYLALFTKMGVREGMAQACSVIAAKLAKQLTTFREAGGITVMYANLNYYESLGDVIRSEQEFGVPFTPVKSGKILTGGRHDPHSYYVPDFPPLTARYGYPVGRLPEAIIKQFLDYDALVCNRTIIPFI